MVWNWNSHTAVWQLSRAIWWEARWKRWWVICFGWKSIGMLPHRKMFKIISFQSLISLLLTSVLFPLKYMLYQLSLTTLTYIACKHVLTWMDIWCDMGYYYYYFYCLPCLQQQHRWIEAKEETHYFSIINAMCCTFNFPCSFPCMTWEIHIVTREKMLLCRGNV